MRKLLMALVVATLLMGFAPDVCAQNMPSVIVDEEGTTELKVQSANVVDSVLTITLQIKNNSEKEYPWKSVGFFGDEPYYLIGSKKFTLMRDLTTGDYLASPRRGVYRTDKAGKKIDAFGMSVNGGEMGTIWMKFPAPPEGKDVIELILPKVPPLTFRVTRL